ncbi:MAG: FAD-binding protein [Desulfobacteraceae bacterium]|nr:FAD-binding protein [Desulfobacteraceae bacterium]MBC2750812.1 FAD-binding protein [Desulfobacteraceae bacterium]
MNRLKTDVLVIGGGAAGIRAAVEAAAHGADVTLVSNAPVTAGGATFSQVSRGWGIQALMEGECSAQHIESFYNEIVAVGQGACDPKLARILVEESGDRVKDLVSYGVRFKKTDDGRFHRAKGCFSETERALITADFDNVRKAFLSILRQHRVRILTGTVIDLVVRDAVCAGAFIFDSANTFSLIDAKATIMAAGGGGAIYENHLCGAESTGDGYALAIRAGARLLNMEFIQFMLGIKSKENRQFLPRHRLYQHNILLDGMGKPVLERCLPEAIQRENVVRLRQNHCPASTCDASFIIDQSVWQATRETGSVFWNADRHPSVIPEVVHMAHAFNGGIRIDARAASTLSGLFAAGEAAAGPHGADRIGGCMMTATQVFGKRAGQFAAQHAGQIKHLKLGAHPRVGCPALKPGEKSEIEREMLDWLEHTIKHAMHTHVNVVRSKKGLETCRRILFDARCRLASMEGATRENYIRYNKVRNMIDVAGRVVESAIRRKDSLGAHFRADIAMAQQTSPSAGAMDCAA